MSAGDAPAGPNEQHPRRTDTNDPKRARRRALAILFQADLRGESPAAALERTEADPHGTAFLDDLDGRDQGWDDDDEDAAPVAPRRAGPLDDFTRRLVRGVDEHLADLDARIGGVARGWSVSRMPVIDRNVLRLATYELTHEDTTPAIVISEALELVKSLSTDKSGRYVNGVLESIRRDVSGE